MKINRLFLAAILLITGCANGGYQRPLEQSIADLGELEVMHYGITIMGSNTSTDKWYKAGKRILIYSADASVTGSINLKNIGWDNISRPDPTNDRKVTLSIPHLTEKNLFVELNEKNIKPVFEKVGTFRWNFGLSEKEEIKKSMQYNLNSRIQEMGLVEETEKAAVEALKVFCSSLGYDLSVKFTGESYAASLSSDRNNDGSTKKE